MAAATPAPISPTFHATAQLAAANNSPPDTLLQSAEGTSFYVHASVLRHASSNAFGGLLPGTPSVDVPVTAQEETTALDLILRVVYRIGTSGKPTPWATLTRTVSRLKSRYGIALPGPGSALFTELMTHVNRADGAQELYGLAGQHQYEALAVAASEHLLALNLPGIRDEWVIQVGAVYLRRLYMLQMDRTQAFIRIVPGKPSLHEPEPACGALEMQENVLGPWAFAVSQLVFEARPDAPNAMIQAKLNPLASSISCKRCSAAVSDRIKDVLQEWSSVKRTI
ncbi:hypothetical protein AURDEDRAFT_184214 [Auricularia subglabra TFB-10046 SS5]|nr:hypothetical protein AURDEDRAFT_184214 [Auricularia subglabra TFB-10046 SS5]